MLPSLKRLKKADFKEIKRQRAVFQSPLFSLSTVASKKAGIKFGVVVSGAITKNKPLRNKTRRRFYSLLKAFSKEDQNLYIIVYPQKKALTARHALLKEEIFVAMKKVLLLK